MFTQNCFVEDPEKVMGLHLVLMGYKQSYHDINLNTAGRYIVAEYGTWHYTDSNNHPNCIDCGEDLLLFMFLSNIRDDTDEYQLFVIDDYNGPKETGLYTIGSIQICESKKAEEYFPIGFTYHRASVEEVVEYINKKRQ